MGDVEAKAISFYKELLKRTYDWQNEWLEYLAVFDKLETEHAILFFMVDSRYRDDLRINRFFDHRPGIGGKAVYYYYLKAKDEFLAFDGDCKYFTWNDISDFYILDDSKVDVSQKIKRIGVVRSDYIRQILLEELAFKEVGTWSIGPYDGPLANPYIDPTRVPSKFDGSMFYVKLRFYDNKLDDERGEYYLQMLTQKLNDLGINNWREGYQIAIHRLYGLH